MLKLVEAVHKNKGVQSSMHGPEIGVPFISMLEPVVVVHKTRVSKAVYMDQKYMVSKAVSMDQKQRV